MAKSPRTQQSLFQWIADRHVDPEPPLMKLSEKIDWAAIDRVLLPYYSPGKGRPAKPTRLMVGLMILKHRFDLSDERVVSGLHENFVWMAFCRVPADEAWHVESSTLCKFRKRLGPEGTQAVEAAIRDQMVKAGGIKHKVMRVDTTAMEKNIAYPTDVGLLQRSRTRVLRLVQKAKTLGVSVPRTLRTFVRVSKKIVLSAAKFGRDKKERAQKAAKRLSSMGEHTLRKVGVMRREIGKRLRSPAVRTQPSVRRTLIRIQEGLQKEVWILERIVTQTKDRLRNRPTEKRVYSVHEPEVTCLTKNKAGKPHEYGVKVSLAVDENGMVVTHAEYADNRHDSTTLEDVLAGGEEATGALPKKLAADRGYGTQDKNAPPALSQIPKVAIHKKGKTRGPLEHTRWFKRLVASRAGIEAVIAHLKRDHGMGRCRYKGFSGDQMNVSWAVLAWNTKKWVGQTSG